MSWQNVKSGPVRAVEYREPGVLDVKLRTGHVYRYSGVSPYLYEAFMRARRKHQYFSDRIAGRFPSGRIA
jgi:hypothetical protein